MQKRRRKHHLQAQNHLLHQSLHQQGLRSLCHHSPHCHQNLTSPDHQKNLIQALRGLTQKKMKLSLNMKQTLQKNPSVQTSMKRQENRGSLLHHHQKLNPQQMVQKRKHKERGQKKNHHHLRRETRKLNLKKKKKNQKKTLFIQNITFQISQATQNKKQKTKQKKGEKNHKERDHHHHLLQQLPLRG